MIGMIALTMALAAGDSPAVGDARMSAIKADLVCLQTGAQKFDDQVSDASTIAKLVVSQCSIARDTMVRETVRGASYQDNQDILDNMAREFAKSDAELALKLVIDARVERKTGAKP